MQVIIIVHERMAKSHPRAVVAGRRETKINGWQEKEKEERCFWNSGSRVIATPAASVSPRTC